MLSSVLLNATWQVALIALAALACARLMRGGRARDEHRLWIAALILAATLPIASEIRIPHARSSSAPPVTEGALPSNATPFTLPRPRIAQPSAITATAVGSLYLLFLGYRALVLWRGWRRAKALLGSATEASDARVIAIAQRCRGAFDLEHVPVLVSSQAETPVTIGARVILPIGIADRLSDESLLSLLGHEMAHAQRRDFRRNLLWEAIFALIAFHPASLLIRRGLTRTREQSCDELVAETLVKPVRYAHALLDVAALIVPQPRATSALAMVDHGFEERVLRLARRPQPRMVARVMFVASCALLAVTIALGSSFGVERIRSRAPVSVDAACSAGLARDPSAIPWLAQMLSDDTSIAPAPCFDSRWSPAIRTFVHPTPGESAAIALASIGEDSLDALVATLDAPSPVARRNAAWAIGEIRGSHGVDRTAAVEPLLRIINDFDPTVRRAAAFAFGELRAGDAIDPLIRALDDSDDGVRAMAAWALGELRARDALESLQHLARGDPNADVRREASYAVGEIQD